MHECGRDVRKVMNGQGKSRNCERNVDRPINPQADHVPVRGDTVPRDQSGRGVERIHTRQGGPRFSATFSPMNQQDPTVASSSTAFSKKPVPGCDSRLSNTDGADGSGNTAVVGNSELGCDSNGYNENNVGFGNVGVEPGSVQHSGGSWTAQDSSVAVNLLDPNGDCEYAVESSVDYNDRRYDSISNFFF